MAGRKRNNCGYHPDHRHRYAWRQVFGKGGYYCLCQTKASEAMAEKLAAMEAETSRSRERRSEAGEQREMML